MALWDDVKDVVVEQLNISPDEVKLESKFREDLGMDALDIIELIMELEDKFDIFIPDDDIPKITSISEAAEYIKRVSNDS